MGRDTPRIEVMHTHTSRQGSTIGEKHRKYPILGAETHAVIEVFVKGKWSENDRKTT